MWRGGRRSGRIVSCDEDGFCIFVDSVVEIDLLMVKFKLKFKLRVSLVEVQVASSK